LNGGLDGMVQGRARFHEHDDRERLLEGQDEVPGVLVVRQLNFVLFGIGLQSFQKDVNFIHL
jgi:hypothetical protein